MEIFLKIVKGALLGLIQGLTEFLPVSSSGHLILFESLGAYVPDVTLNLFFHVATLLAVTILLRKELAHCITHPLEKGSLWLLTATVPTAVIAILFKKFLPNVLEGGFLAPCFFLSAVLLLLPSFKKTSPLSVKNAVFVGICQGIAVLPGISRSGATISAMRMAGIEENERVKLSFLLSFPIIIGGALVEIPSVDLGAIDLYSFIPAMLTAFVSGGISLKVMLKAYSPRSALPFSIYLFLLAIFTATMKL